MHSLRKIRRVTIERTWEVIGTGGMHKCIPYERSLQIPIPQIPSLSPCVRRSKMVCAQLFTILPKNNALPAPSFSRPGIGKMQKFLDYGV